MDTVPAEVAALVGPHPEDRSGEGVGSVLVGNGHVARIGPPEIVAREAFVLDLDAFPLDRPALVAAGEGWVVSAEVADDEGPWDDEDLRRALADLARLHDHYQDAPPPDGGVLRRPFDPPTAERLLARPGPRPGSSRPSWPSCWPTPHRWTSMKERPVSRALSKRSSALFVLVGIGFCF
ncbi:MAG: hypothetical protein ACRDYV_01200 [Acidimicrobiia bacterium]